MNPTLTELVIPDDLAAALAPATGPVDLRTQSGRKLGRYTPGEKPEPPIPWEPDVTREEIDRRIRTAQFRDLTDAAKSSLEFWNNPFDDEDWNHATAG